MTASYCPSCDPKNPHYFRETEQYFQCVYEEAGGGGGGPGPPPNRSPPAGHDWQVALPNDHVWSGAQDDGKALAARIRATCGSRSTAALDNFVAYPVDELGTVDVTFTTGVDCGVERVEFALFRTMRGWVPVECKRMPPGA